eukprot:scaffold324447_cov61-Tisochrysis_lutea.AAC.3
MHALDVSRLLLASHKPTRKPVIGGVAPSPAPSLLRPPCYGQPSSLIPCHLVFDFFSALPLANLFSSCAKNHCV